jgi:hypothetical protein
MGKDDMRKFIYIVIGILLFAGCASLNEKIIKQYHEIDYSDGVSEEEAKVIAQKSLMDSPFNEEDYELEKGDVRWFAEDYPDYWFVDFPNTPFRHVPYLGYMVVIKKDNGDIEYSGPHKSYFYVGWVFDKNFKADWIYRGQSNE